ncbi:hypothetical protein GLP25_14755 [Photobacterium phosphoreum]|nr:hypothetical protein [Photobacterium phosphoreum]
MRDVCEKRIKRKDAAQLLNVSVRQVQRLITRYRDLGAVGFGQSIILGGLVSEESRNNDTGVPILKDLLLIGSLFGSTLDREINNQLSVLIKASII